MEQDLAIAQRALAALFSWPFYLAFTCYIVYAAFLAFATKEVRDKTQAGDRVFSFYRQSLFPARVLRAYKNLHQDSKLPLVVDVLYLSSGLFFGLTCWRVYQVLA